MISRSDLGRSDEDMDLDAEAVIGAVLEIGQRSELPPVVFELEPDDFPDQKYADIWEAIRACLDDGSVDPLACLARMKALETYDKGDQADVMRIWGNLASTVNLDTWASRVKKSSSDRRARAQIAEAHRIAEREPDITVAMQALKREIARIETIERPSEDGSLGAAFREMHDGGSARHFSTGVDGIDQVVTLSRKHLWIVGAEPGVGKSAFAAQVCINAAEGNHRSAFMSLEMPATEIWLRAVANVAGVRLNRIRDVKKQDETEKDLVAGAFNRLNKLPIHVAEASGMKLSQVLSAARSRKPDIVVVDYLTRVKADTKHERRDLEIGAIANGLKTFALQENCLVICLSQFNRNDGRPTMARLRDSGEIEQAADTISLLWRPVVDEPSRVEMIVAKQRSGTAGVTVPLQFDGARMRFRG